MLTPWSSLNLCNLEAEGTVTTPLYRWICFGGMLFKVVKCSNAQMLKFSVSVLLVFMQQRHKSK